MSYSSSRKPLLSAKNRKVSLQYNLQALTTSGQQQTVSCKQESMDPCSLPSMRSASLTMKRKICCILTICGTKKVTSSARANIYFVVLKNALFLSKRKQNMKVIHWLCCCEHWKIKQIVNSNLIRWTGKSCVVGAAGTWESWTHLQKTGGRRADVWTKQRKRKEKQCENNLWWQGDAQRQKQGGKGMRMPTHALCVCFLNCLRGLKWATWPQQTRADRLASNTNTYHLRQEEGVREEEAIWRNTDGGCSLIWKPAAKRCFRLESVRRK